MSPDEAGGPYARSTAPTPGPRKNPATSKITVTIVRALAACLVKPGLDAIYRLYLITSPPCEKVGVILSQLKLLRLIQPAAKNRS